MTKSQAEAEREWLEAYSRCEMSAIELRRRLGNATYGGVLQRLSEADLPLPRAPTAGREAEIARARAWLFPKHDNQSEAFHRRRPEHAGPPARR